eukprot:TRINITY_DN8416_c1_g1_i1.p1 TRINITY_DN8416_c1_g1~~TRINITY_DN8416_c1_g1_i1.p1  ORF type:complete len:269 (+),score=-9.96 TRINITY_DN8416_c1_g1_i1:975-1781(+)
MCTPIAQQFHPPIARNDKESNQLEHQNYNNCNIECIIKRYLKNSETNNLRPLLYPSQPNNIQYQLYLWNDLVEQDFSLEVYFRIIYKMYLQNEQEFIFNQAHFLLENTHIHTNTLVKNRGLVRIQQTKIKLLLQCPDKAFYQDVSRAHTLMSQDILVSTIKCARQYLYNQNKNLIRNNQNSIQSSLEQTLKTFSVSVVNNQLEVVKTQKISSTQLKSNNQLQYIISYNNSNYSNFGTAIILVCLQYLRVIVSFNYRQQKYHIIKRYKN